MTGNDNTGSSGSPGRLVSDDSSEDTIIESSRTSQTPSPSIPGLDSSTVSLHFDCDASATGWSVEKIVLEEKLNTPFRASINLSSEEPLAEPNRLLGQSCRITIERGNLLRQIKGIIEEVHEINITESSVFTDIVVVPALEALKHRKNTRIFQQKTIPDILRTVLEEGLAPYQRDVELRLETQYPTCEYRTQYNETDLEFCQRLMEEEGIVYWFEFDDDFEKLVLSDNPTHYGEVESTDGSLIRYTAYEGSEPEGEYISQFELTSQIRPTKVAVRLYNWTHPSTMVENSSGRPEHDEQSEGENRINGSETGPEREEFEHDHTPITFFDYDGQYQNNTSGTQSQLRRESQSFDAYLAQGASSVIGVTAGCKYELISHPRGELDGTYLILSVKQTFEQCRCKNTFTCITEDVPFRPKRDRQKPRVPGIQTAIVVGPEGEDIHTDEHGRIKVRFHWDRATVREGESSCFVRVIQPWAGAGFGTVVIPRIGMEVAISFINGDLDQPVVIGALYNGNNPTPYGLPNDKTKTVFKSQSTPGANGYNELTFEDAADQEKIIVHAQKDYEETIQHDHSTTVHHDQKNKVDGNLENKVEGDHNEEIGGDQVFKITGGRTGRIEGTYSLRIEGGESSHTVEGTHILTASEEVTIRAQNKITLQCGSSRMVIEPNQISVSSGGGASQTIGEDIMSQSSQGSSMNLGSNASVSSSGHSSISLSDSASVQSSQGAGLDLSSTGTISTSQGATVTVNGDKVLLNC